MLTLRPLQRAIGFLYKLDIALSVDEFVRPLHARDPEAIRREVVLVSEIANDIGDCTADSPSQQCEHEHQHEKELHIAVLLDPKVMLALKGDHVPGLSKFHAWRLALEGVSHFVKLVFRASHNRPISRLELELQAEVDKFLVAFFDRVPFRSSSELSQWSAQLRRALFSSPTFIDPPETEEGERYRQAHELALRYVCSLERRFIRTSKLALLVEEIRTFYRSGLEDKRAMALAA